MVPNLEEAKYFVCSDFNDFYTYIMHVPELLTNVNPF